MNLAIAEQDARDRARDSVADAQHLPWYRANKWTVAVVDGNRTDFWDTDEHKMLFSWPYAIDSDEMASDLLEVYAAGEDAK